jgi:N-glycosylase/DNA lyase
VFPARDYDLAATLDSGQAFRWRPDADGSWRGVVAGRWVRLRRLPNGIAAETVVAQTDWAWLKDYLQVDVDLRAILRTFPDDAPLREAVRACRGLRLLRQEPWECLASFILSSNKRIAHIRQIIETLCERFGEPVAVPAGEPPAFAFPSPERIARLGERELRACGMGFRAPYLLAAARRVTAGDPDLERLGAAELATARARLCELPGVGPKIADCVLLFAFGFARAFPMDVWVLRALRRWYFKGQRPTPARLRAFAQNHFGPHAGYAQQYLFHYIRTQPAATARADTDNAHPGHAPNS